MLCYNLSALTREKLYNVCELILTLKIWLKQLNIYRDQKQIPVKYRQKNWWHIFIYKSTSLRWDQFREKYSMQVFFFKYFTSSLTYGYLLDQIATFEPWVRSVKSPWGRKFPLGRSWTSKVKRLSREGVAVATISKKHSTSKPQSQHTKSPNWLLYISQKTAWENLLKIKKTLGRSFPQFPWPPLVIMSYCCKEKFNGDHFRGFIGKV